jgi:D-sedoheptulose 7-phosphate isomerase
MATEFVSRLRKEVERPGLPAIALTTDTSFLTAYANDYDYDGVFERQVETLGGAGDVLVGISTSGESRNVIRAVQAARSREMRVIVLTGAGGDALASLADAAVCIPSTDTQHVQEAHLAVEHVLCDLVESWLFAPEGRPQEARGVLSSRQSGLPTPERTPSRER